MIGIEKNKLLLGMFLFLFVLLGGPFLINLLMFKQNIIPVSGDYSLWIPSLSTYIGALFGGVISGLITLFGVIFTINNSNIKEKEKELPKKLEIAEQLERNLFELKKIVVSNESYSSIDLKRKIRADVNKFVIEKKLVDLSINLSEPVYRQIKLLESSTYDMSEIKSTTFYLNAINSNKIQDIIDLVKSEKEMLLVKIFA